MSDGEYQPNVLPKVETSVLKVVGNLNFQAQNI